MTNSSLSPLRRSISFPSEKNDSRTNKDRIDDSRIFSIRSHQALRPIRQEAPHAEAGGEIHFSPRVDEFLHRHPSFHQDQFKSRNNFETQFFRLENKAEQDLYESRIPQCSLFVCASFDITTTNIAYILCTYYFALIIKFVLRLRFLSENGTVSRTKLALRLIICAPSPTSIETSCAETDLFNARRHG